MKVFGCTLALVGLIGWAVLCPPAAGGAPASPGSAPGRSAWRGVDRTLLAEELGRLPGDPQGHQTEALQGHARRLAELYGSLESSGDLPPAERRAMGERLLARMAQVGLVLRQRVGDPGESDRGATSASAAWGSLPARGGLGGVLADYFLLLLGLLGGVVIAFALGSLAGYRRGSREASYYGEGDPRIRFLTKPSGGPEERGEGRVSRAQLRDRLAAGRPVMFQLGYEIAPAQRRRFLTAIRRMQAGMGGAEGWSYTVWEDPRHSHRFYELLVCFRPGALDQLAERDGGLAALAAEIEACRVPGGPIFRRVWWEVPPRRSAAAPRSGPAQDA